MIGWYVYAVDKDGASHRVFVKGPETEQQVQNWAKVTLRNWTVTRWEPTDKEPEKRSVLPSSAYSYGVLEKGLKNRRR